MDDRLALGELVAGAVQARKEEDAARILARLNSVAIDVAVRPAGLDLMVLQASFLVERGHLAEFDTVVDELDAESRGRVRLSATGPLPPYSFANLELNVDG